MGFWDEWIVVSFQEKDQIAVVTLVWTSHSHFSASHSQWTAMYPSCQVVAPALQGAKPLVLIQEST